MENYTSIYVYIWLETACENRSREKCKQRDGLKGTYPFLIIRIWREVRKFIIIARWNLPWTPKACTIRQTCIPTISMPIDTIEFWTTSIFVLLWTMFMLWTISMLVLLIFLLEQQIEKSQHQASKKNSSEVQRLSVTKVGPCLWWVSSPQWGQMSYLFTRWWPFKTIIVKVTILYQLCKILLWICEIHRYLRKENRWWGQLDCQYLMGYLCDTPEHFERDLMIARDSKPWVQLSLRSNHAKLKLVDWSFIHHLVHQERLIMSDWHDMQCTSKNMILIIPRYNKAMSFRNL